MARGKSFLITRPKYEFLTNLLFHWSDVIIGEASKQGYQVLDLKDRKANKADLKSYVIKNNPALVCFNGHGSKEAIAGHNDEILIQVGDGDELLAGTIVYARSCDAAQGLGPAAVKKGSRAFLGYKRPFVVASSDKRVSNPRGDKLSALFIEPSNLAPTTLLKGNSVEEADKRSKAAMLKNILFMLSSAATDEQQSVASYLWGNYKAQVIVGDALAVV